MIELFELLRLIFRKSCKKIVCIYLGNRTRYLTYEGRINRSQILSGPQPAGNPIDIAIFYSKNKRIP